MNRIIAFMKEALVSWLPPCAEAMSRHHLGLSQTVSLPFHVPVCTPVGCFFAVRICLWCFAIEICNGMDLRLLIQI